MIKVNKMNWKEELAEKYKRKNQILFSKDSVFLSDLNMIIAEQNHKTLVLWAFDLAAQAVEALEEKYPDEVRPRTALELSKKWAKGEIKMPAAKRAILACHAVAKEITDKECIALCHAIGQACSVVHTVSHAIGFPVYDLTAIVRKHGIDECEEALIKRKNEYIDLLLYWQKHSNNPDYTWAEFMTK